MYNTQSGDTFLMEELWYIPMGDHVPVYNRPYIVNSDADAVSTITDRMFENSTTTLSPTILGDMSSRLIQPNAHGEVTIIDNNWVSTRRYVFVLKVRTIDSMGNEGYSYVQGYTDHDGITNQGNANGEMVHFINTVIETSVLTFNTPMGISRTEKLRKIYNVMASHNQEYFTQRPRDVIENIDLMNMAQVMSEGDMMVDAVHVGNMVNPFNQTVISSAVSNNVGSEYLCKILNGGVAKSKSKNVFTDSYEVMTDSSMGDQILEPSINDNRFIKYLSSSAGFTVTRDSFTFNQLMMIDPTIHDRFTLINISKNYVNPLTQMTPTVGEYWHGQDPVTLRAYSLIESSVSLATRHGFSKLFFTATNMADPTGRIDIFINDFDSYIKLGDRDLAQLLDIFKNRFVMDSFISETNGGVVPMYMEMYVDLLGTSKIKLSYSHFPETWYTIPTTANSLFSPILTVDRNNLDAVTQQFSGLVDAIAHQESQFRSYY